MRNPNQKELEKIWRLRNKKEDLEVELDSLLADMRQEFHKLRRKCGAPSHAGLDSETFSQWVKGVQTKDGPVEVLLVEEKTDGS